MTVITGKNKTERLVADNEAFNTAQQQTWTQYREELLAHRPIQYVTGISYFYGLRLFVNESVLIPRPETEELVDWALRCREERFSEPVRVLDIGTGSGCIALAYKSRSRQDEVMAMDIAEAALAVARENAGDLNLAVTFIRSDILQNAPEVPGVKFDIIISNPPYIIPDEKVGMDTHVLAYEPHNALFVTDFDAQQFYKAINHFCKDRLSDQGILLLEVHQEFAADTAALFTASGWQMTLRNDLNNNPRMLLVHR